ncbi:MAG: tRNA 5-methoxyuridine(34)/uridine 5-oxyacetic acid(34) synthase CmoB, partial [Mariprofundaceae bacterium]
LHPWRKGPFDFFGIHIDTEWRSDWKWNRLKDAITPLTGRQVLDVGCGSGYHAWRMLGDGAAKVVAIDPTLLFAMQFHACQRYIADARLQFWPIGIDDLPDGMASFDTVFSMGILYHRRSPIDHLLQLKGLLRPGGELVLETLIVEGGPDSCLIPNGRYAKMRNVWFIPSIAMLETWLMRAGLSDIRVIDVSPTSVNEQRSTEWMRFESLPDFLDQANPALTIEGHPAPVRAILRANT